MAKERFVNEKILVQNLPVFFNGNKTEEELDKLVDFIEETLILEKAKEIEMKREARSLKTLLIDDVREMQVTKIARTFDEGIEVLRSEGPWQILYLDHDLGDPDPAKTGYDILNWLEVNPEYLPKEIKLVTANPVGRQKMQVVINKLYGGSNE